MTVPEVRRFDYAHEFLAHAGAYLSAREAEHNLLLGLAGVLTAKPDLYGLAPYFAAVQREGAVIAAALRTPPHTLVLSEVTEPAAVDALATDVAEVFGELPGVLGPRDASVRFAELWSEATGRRAERAMAERIFRAETVHTPRGVPGSIRRATNGDRSLLVEWFEAFQDEAMGGRSFRPAEDAVDDYLTRGDDSGLYLWEGRRGGIARRLRRSDAERRPHRAGVHAAGPTRPRLRERAHGRPDVTSTVVRASLLLPLHGSRQSDIEPDLSTHRLRAGQRRRRIPFPLAVHRQTPVRQGRPRSIHVGCRTVIDGGNLVGCRCKPFAEGSWGEHLNRGAEAEQLRLRVPDAVERKGDTDPFATPVGLGIDRVDRRLPRRRDRATEISEVIATDAQRDLELW